jgi:hypothetical protein
MVRNEAEQPQPENNAEEAMAGAVHSLVEESIHEAGNYTISVEEEPAPERRLPLQDTTAAAMGTLKNTAGTATDTSKKVAGSVLSNGLAIAEEAARVAQEAVAYVQDENIVERTAAFLEDAEYEGKRLVDVVSDYVGRTIDR